MTLPRTLESLQGSALIGEVIVADGGSTDQTQALAEQKGAKVFDCERGRGAQLSVGAKHAQNDWLLFLHADTFLGAGWEDAVRFFINEQTQHEHAAVFRFALDDGSLWARWLERMVAFRVHAFGLPYGDQGLLIHRRFYDTLGGFQPLPLMEDVDLIRRIGRRRFSVLPAPAITSSVRYRREGYILRPLRNLMCLALYFLGVPPRTIEADLSMSLNR